MTDLPTDMATHNRALIEEFRASGRRLGERPLLLLTTTGRRSDEARTTPMMYVRVDDRLLVLASNAGAPKHPDWYLNLVVHPNVTVEVDGEEYAATAVVASGADRDKLFAACCERYPFFTDHQDAIDRTIPVVELLRRTD